MKNINVKLDYIKPDVDIIKLDEDDIIATSGDQPQPGPTPPGPFLNNNDFHWD